MSCRLPIVVLETLSRGLSFLLRLFCHVNRDESPLTTLLQRPIFFLVLLLLLIDILVLICIVFERSFLPNKWIIALNQKHYITLLDQTLVVSVVSLDYLRGFVAEAHLLTVVWFCDTLLLNHLAKRGKTFALKRAILNRVLARFLVLRSNGATTIILIEPLPVKLCSNSHIDWFGSQISVLAVIWDVEFHYFGFFRYLFF